jgi:hypothetical protein
MMLDLATAAAFTLAILMSLLFGASSHKLGRMLDAGVDEHAVRNTPTYLVAGFSMVALMFFFVGGLATLLF